MPAAPLPPRSSTAVHASVATPIPKVGSPAAASTSERSSARPTPMGVPVPWCTTRRPVIALPGEEPVVPRTIARTSQVSTAVPATAPTVIQRSPSERTHAPAPAAPSTAQPSSRSTAKAVNRRSSSATG